jgi:hypothetical protein
MPVNYKHVWTEEDTTTKSVPKRSQTFVIAVNLFGETQQFVKDFSRTSSLINSLNPSNTTRHHEISECFGNNVDQLESKNDNDLHGHLPPFLGD